MFHDLVFCATNEANLTTVLTSVEATTILGVLIRTDPGSTPALPDGFHGVKGVDFIYLPDVEGDPMVWLIMRLSGTMVAADIIGGADDDNWNKSLFSTQLRTSYSEITVRGNTVFEKDMGGGDVFQIWRGSEMEGTGNTVNYIAGGDYY